MAAPATARFYFHCICGAVAYGSVGPPSSLPRLADSFWKIHSGPGHGKAKKAEKAAKQPELFDDKRADKAAEERRERKRKENEREPFF